MAVLHKKEEKIQAVLGRLSKNYTDEEFIAQFIKVYFKDWGKIKSAYVKQSQDKAIGTVINMPKPEVYLKQILASYLKQTAEKNAVLAKETKPSIAVIKKTIKQPKEKVVATLAEVKKPKAVPTGLKKKVAVKEDVVDEVKKPKVAAKK